MKDSESESDIQLNVYYQPAKNGVKSRNILIINHGFNSHIMKYNAMAHYFSQKMDYEVWGFDSRGFGKSEGFKGYLENDIQIYVEDNRSFIQLIQKYYNQE